MTDLLGVVTSSEKRRNLLLLLRTGPKTLDEIKDTLHVTASGMLPQIKILADRNLIGRRDREYFLTDMGEVTARHLSPFMETIEIFEREKEFWQEHNIGAIPTEFLMTIGDLGDIRIIESGDEEIYESHHEFQNNILKSSTFRGVSPIFHPIYPTFFLELAKKGGEVSLILTDKVFKKMLSDYYDMVSEGLALNNASLYVYDREIKLAYIATDHYFSLSLYYNNGIFDSKRDLISSDRSALQWAERLFNYYRERSRKIESV